MARILVIEDEADVRELYRTCLEDLGHKVVEAKDGYDGFDQLTRDRFDLAILDLLMPECDGASTLMAQAGVEDETPVIVISAYIEEELEAKLRELDSVKGVLKKPADMEKLTAEVTAILNNER